MGACEKGHLGVNCFTWVDAFREDVGYMGNSGNRSCQWASRNVFKCFTEVALTISAGSLFQQRVWWKRISDCKPSLTNTTESILSSIPMCDRLPSATTYHSSPFTHFCINSGLKWKGSETDATQYTTSRCMLLYLINKLPQTFFQEWRLKATGLF